MASSSYAKIWLIADLETATNSEYNKKRLSLYKAANGGNWDAVFSILQDAESTYGESWVNCQLSSDGWTLLHYAAYQGKPVYIMEKLLGLGALRMFINFLLNLGDFISNRMC
jgi:hypothetical protein